MSKPEGPNWERVTQGRGDARRKDVRFHFGREVRRFDAKRLLLDDEPTVEAPFVVINEKTFVTCNRDTASLVEEAAWDRSS